jgi:hypothetical protein
MYNRFGYPMRSRTGDRRTFLRLLLASAALAPARGLAAGAGPRQTATPAGPAGHHVYPKDRIQDAIEAAAAIR